jgi:crotonobetainyl-CoA:carnitine CoA-transferase CaiB-like acyl-CoA transferase
MPGRPRAWGIYETFATGDGTEIFVGITSDKQWKAFCDAFNRPDLRDDERFATNEKRRAEHSFLHSELTGIFSAFSGAELAEKLVAIGLPAAPLRKPGDLFDDPQLNGAGRMSRTRFPDGTYANLPRLPVVFSDRSAAANGQTPSFGQHTDAILERFGISPEEAARLRQAEIVA